MDTKYETVTLRNYESADDAQRELWRSFENELMKVLYVNPMIKQHLHAEVRHRFFNKDYNGQYQPLDCQFFDTSKSNTDKDFFVTLPSHQGTYLCRADDKSALFTAFKACVLDVYNRQSGTQKTDVRFRNAEFHFNAVPRRKQQYDSEEVNRIVQENLAQTVQFRIKI